MKPVFLVLEPVNHVYKVIEAARRRGFDVLVFHTLPLAPPAPYDAGIRSIASAHSLESWLDWETVLRKVSEVVAGRTIAGTYTAVEAALRVEAHLRSMNGLPTNTLEVIDHVLNKPAVRTTLREHGLSTLRHIDEREMRVLAEWPFKSAAAFFKPANGAGSIHVSRCETVDEVKRKLARWDAGKDQLPGFVEEHLRKGLGVFLEEAALGKLMSLEGFCYGGRYTPVGLTSRDVLARDVAVEMGATFPFASARMQEIVEKVSAIHQALGIHHGATHTELIVPNSGPIELVELNLRFAGADLLIVVNEALDLQFEDALVDLSVGQPARFEPSPRARAFASVQYLLAPSGTQVLEAIEVDDPEVIFLKVMKKLGSTLASTDFQGDHIAGFAVRAPTYTAVTSLAREIRAKIKVNGAQLGGDPNNVTESY